MRKNPLNEDTFKHRLHAKSYILSETTVFIRLNILQRIWFPFWYPGRYRILNFFLPPQLTTATRYTLSYICSRGLTCIYTRGNTGRKEWGWNKDRVPPHRRYSRKNTQKETDRAMTYKTGGHTSSPYTRSTCTRWCLLHVGT